MTFNDCLELNEELSQRGNKNISHLGSFLPRLKGLTVALCLALAFWFSAPAAHAAGLFTVSAPTTNSGTNTTNIQNALNAASTAGGGTVQLAPDQTYVVVYTGDKSVYQYSNLVTQRYALLLPSNVTLDLNGSTIMLDAGKYCSIILNTDCTSASGSYDQNLSVINGTIDSNCTNNQIGAAHPTVASVAGIQIQHAQYVTLKNLTFNNAQDAGLVMMDVDYVTADSLHVTSSNGYGFQLGAYDASQTTFNNYCRNSTFGTLIADNCLTDTYNPSGINNGSLSYLQGNPVIGDMVNVSFGTLIANKCGAVGNSKTAVTTSVLTTRFSMG